MRRGVLDGRCWPHVAAAQHSDAGGAGDASATALPRNGLSAPAGTPPAVPERIGADVVQTPRSAEAQRRNDALHNGAPAASSDFARFVAAERARRPQVAAQRRSTADPS